MNPDLIFRLLQVGVIAPYLFMASREQSPYFNVGLKLTAGTLVLLNAPVLIAAFRQYATTEGAAWLAQRNTTRRARVIDGEAVSV